MPSQPTQVQFVSDELMHAAMLHCCQALNRCSNSNKSEFMCLHASGRLWLCHRRRWVLGPEHLMAHAYSPIPATQQYKHVELIDLLGNSFSGTSVQVALLSQLDMCASLGRAMQADPPH